MKIVTFWCACAITGMMATSLWAANPTPMAASRFLEQAAFGASANDAVLVRLMGFGPWIDSQLITPGSAIPDPSVDAKGNTSLRPAQDAFFVNAATGQDQLRQRVAFALSQIWVVSDVKLKPEAIVPYLRMLQTDAFETYDKIMYDVTLSPAMGHYLDMVNNNKPTNGRGANENYARELLQLFTVGLEKLDVYGRPMKDAKGVPIATYDQDMVEGFARAFTGWTYAPKPGANSRFGNPVNWDAPMVAFAANHDTSAGKKLLNNVMLPANRTAEQDLKDALANIFYHPNMGPFICRQLIQRLVTSQPSDAYVRRIATVFDSAPRGSMKAVVKAILLDPEARQGDDGTEHAAQKLREPALWMSALLRGLNAQVVSPNSLATSTAKLGQNLYNSPSVFNYYSPAYTINISAIQTHNAPEFELLSGASAMAAADFVNSVVYGKPTGVTVDLTPYVTPLGPAPGAAEAGRMVDSLNTALLGGRMTSKMRDTIITAARKATNPKAMVQTAVYLIGSSWDFQVER